MDGHFAFSLDIRSRTWQSGANTAVVFGWVLGWLYWRSGTIWIPVAAHVFNNFVGVAMIWCTEDTDTTLVELCGGAVAASVWALAAAVCGYVGYRYLDKVLEGKGIGRG